MNLTSSPQWKEFQKLLKEGLKKHFNMADTTDECFEEANEPEERHQGLEEAFGQNDSWSLLVHMWKC